MTGPLGALDARYERLLQWTLDLPHLGLPSAEPGTATTAMLPEPGTIAEINTKTRDPHVIGVELTDAGSRKRFVALRCPTAFWEGRRITHDLVHAGVHPQDIKVITMAATHTGPIVACVRTSIEWLFWTSRDQAELEAEIYGD